MKKVVVILIVILLIVVGLYTFNKKSSNSNISYEIVKDNDYNSEYKERGYYVQQQENGKYLVTIAMGEQSTGGFDLKIDKVKISNDDIIIYVKEKKPSDWAIVTDARTYPKAQVIFDEKPSSLIIKSNNSNNNFKKRFTN